VNAEQYEVSTDRTRIDVAAVARFLSAHSYWAAGIPLETVRRSIEHSLCFGAYRGSEQAGFARVITDYATFAYIADVFVVAEHRGLGVARRLMSAIMTHPELQGLRRWMLITRDAHALYEKFGFMRTASPERVMERRDPDVYKARGEHDGKAIR
jgi:GNAT superfamily N-acetyltransferase